MKQMRIPTRSLLVSATLTLGFMTPGITAEAATISKSDLIREIKDRREAIADLDVEFSFYAVGQTPSNAVHDDTRRVVLSGSRFLMDRDYRIGSLATGEVFGCSCSYDGRNAWAFQAVNGLAYTQRDPGVPLLDTEGSGFFDLLMWYPCAEVRGGGLHPNDLLSILDSPDTKILDNMELVNGRPCHVAEYSPNGQLVTRVRIDPGLGYLAIDQEHTTCYAVESVVNFQITDYLEVAQGVWLPIEGERVLGAQPGVEEMSRGLRYEMKVLVDGNAPLLKVNEGVANGTFDLSNKLPPSTVIIDLDSGRRWSADARNFEAAADAALASLTLDRHPARGNAAGDTSPWGDPRWIAAVVVAGLIGAGLTLASRRP